MSTQKIILNDDDIPDPDRYDLSKVPETKPIEISEEKRKAFLAGDKEDLSASSFIASVNPEKKDHAASMVNSSLNGHLKRKMRVSVTCILSAIMGREFAEGHWEHEIDLIIKAHLVKKYPKQWDRTLDQDQVKTIEERFPIQLQLLATIQELIDEGKSEDQLIYFLQHTNGG